MDTWSGRRLLFRGGGVGDNTLGEHGMFLRGGLIYWERSLLVATLNDLFFAASLDASRRCIYLKPRRVPLFTKNALCFPCLTCWEDDD